jgi:hypothetical protein
MGNIPKKPCVGYSNCRFVETLVVLQDERVKIAPLLLIKIHKHTISRKLLNARILSPPLSNNATLQAFFGAQALAAGLALNTTSVLRPTTTVYLMLDVQYKLPNHEKFSLFMFFFLCDLL